MTLSAFDGMLIAHFIQVSVVAFVVAILVRCIGQSRPHLAHVLWGLVLLKCITPPIIASPTGVFSWIGSAKSAQSPSGWTLAIHEDASATTAAFQKEYLVSKQKDEIPSERDAGYSTARESQRPCRFRDFALACSSFATKNTITSIWLGICFAICGGLMVRLVRFLVLVQRLAQEQSHESEVQNSRASLAANRVKRLLNLRCTVRVLVLDHPLGPAIVGLVRPTIVLPRVVVESSSGAELEALIAHELVHFRRGDLWWSILQAMAVSVSWCNPLVWFASRSLSQEAEKCCDQETVVGLGISPAAYARCLISVLEQKQSLHVAPLLPGVRPVGVTSNRLERIMRFGQGSQSRCPRWVKVVLLVGAAVALPGTAFSDSDNEVDADNEAPQILYRLKIIEVPTDKVAAMVSAWNVATSSTFQTSRSAAEAPAESQVVQASFKSAESTYSVHTSNALDEMQVEQLIEAGDVLSVPKFVAPNGGLASTQIGSEVPFITAFEPAKSDGGEKQPIIDYLKIGIGLDLTGTLDEENENLALKLAYKHTVLKSMDSFTFESDGEPLTVQQPDYSSHEIQSTRNVPLNQTVAICGGPIKRDVVVERSVPFLGKIPYVSRLFKNKALATESISTVILIRCETAKPGDTLHTPETPISSQPQASTENDPPRLHQGTRRQ